MVDHSDILLPRHCHIDRGVCADHSIHHKGVVGLNSRQSRTAAARRLLTAERIAERKLVRQRLRLKRQQQKQRQASGRNYEANRPARLHRAKQWRLALARQRSAELLKRVA
jgi:hypothetical protein